jgi:hypothetical protein
MRWPEVREAYPNQWLVIEALDAHTVNDRRILDRVAVVELCSDGASAMQRYRDLHKRYPMREFYFVHSSRETIEIVEHWWLGIRTSAAAYVER